MKTIKQEEINAEITDKRNEFGLTTGGKGH